MSSDQGRTALSSDQVTARLAGSRLWRDVHVLDDVGSTSSLLAARAVEGSAREGAVVTADHQSAGRGRLDRTWSAPPRSSLAVSVLLAPTVDVARWSWLPLLAGLAMTDLLTQGQGGPGLPSRLKWPNDVLVGGRKVCGVLAEVVSTPGGPMVVVGAGLNVSLEVFELPVPTATSLLLAGSATLDRVELLAGYLEALEVRYTAWRTAGGDPVASGLAQAYRAACSTIGQTVQVSLPSGPVLSGRAWGVDDLGRLLVTDETQAEHALAAGDVIHVRGTA